MLGKLVHHSTCRYHDSRGREHVRRNVQSRLHCRLGNIVLSPHVFLDLIHRNDNARAHELQGAHKKSAAASLPPPVATAPVPVLQFWLMLPVGRPKKAQIESARRDWSLRNPFSR
jgi:hypothetical protein